jgi:hypothetical protein
MKTFRALSYVRKYGELDGWPVGITFYQLGDRCHCKVDNVNSGAVIARADGATQAEAEAEAIARARSRLSTARRPLKKDG